MSMTSWRYKTLQVIFLLCNLLVIFRLFYWQILSSPRLQALAESQHFTQEEIPARRGQILTSDSFPLVTNKQAFLVYGLLSQIKSEKNEIAAKIAEIINPEDPKAAKEELKDVLDKKDINWVPLARSVDRETKEKIEGLKISGIGFEEIAKRYYPEASMSAQMLGFVGRDANGREKGYFGIEGYYNRTLEGKPGFIKEERDATGQPILIGQSDSESEIAGRDLKLFIDRGMQFMVEDKLKKGIERFQAKAGLAVIMDPKTGAILTMSSFPNYDPLKYAVTDKSLFSNPVIGQTFEPGSIFKPLIMAAAINEKAIRPDDKCTRCDGPRQIGEYTINTWDGKFHPDSAMTDILVYSDNVGMVFVSEKLGGQKEIEYIKKFGIDEPTNIDLEGEMAATLRKEDEWVTIDFATASFGQGVAVTPIQMVRAISAIANGGELMEPHVVAQIKDQDKILETKPKVIRRVISPTTAKVVTEMMVAVAERGGKWDRPKGYRIAGKTGTAQIPIAGHYDKTKTVVSFVGFAPADNPRFVMLITLTEPALTWGSMTVAPVWFDISKSLLNYLKIPPSF